MASERSANAVPSLTLKSNANDSADVIGWADPTTHRILVDSSGSLSSEQVDDAVFTVATSKVLMAGFLADDFPVADTLNEGDGGAARMSTNRILFVQGEVPAGSPDSANPLKIGGIFNTTAPTYTNGTVGDFQMTARGNFKAELFSTTSSLSNSSGVYVQGITAHDGNAPFPNPVIQGGYASAAAPSSVSGDGDVTRIWCLRNGAQAVEITSAGALIPGNATDGLLVNLGANNDVINSGTFVVQENGAALTALQLIDDTIFADDAAFTLSTSKSGVVAGVAVQTDGTDPTAVSAEGDAAALRTDMNRVLLVNTTPPRLVNASENNASAQTNNPIHSAPGANLSLYITDIIVSNGATAGSIRFVEDTGGTPVIRVQETYMAINGGAVMSFKTPIRVTTNKDFGYTSTTVTTHSVTVHGYIAP